MKGNLFPMELFVKKVLLESCKFKAMDVYHLRASQTMDTSSKLLQDTWKKGNETMVLLLDLQPHFSLSSQKESLITAYMFNPCVLDVHVLAFLVC